MKNIDCKCVKEYLFNKTDTFPGVLFKENEIYKFVGPDIRIKNTNLVAVINDNQKAFVGMDIDRFNRYFKVMLNSSDSNTIKICNDYNINYLITK